MIHIKSAKEYYPKLYLMYNVNIIASDRKTVLRTCTHYIIKGLPNHMFENVYHTETEALEEFKQLKDK